jgi:hypothetical protein
MKPKTALWWMALLALISGSVGACTTGEASPGTAVDGFFNATQINTYERVLPSDPTVPDRHVGARYGTPR